VSLPDHPGSNLNKSRPTRQCCRWSTRTILLHHCVGQFATSPSTPFKFCLLARASKVHRRSNWAYRGRGAVPLNEVGQPGVTSASARVASLGSPGSISSARACQAYTPPDSNFQALILSFCQPCARPARQTIGRGQALLMSSVSRATKMDPDEMRLRASRYRDIARRITDEILPSRLSMILPTNMRRSPVRMGTTKAAKGKANRKIAIPRASRQPPDTPSFGHVCRDRSRRCRHP